MIGKITLVGSNKCPICGKEFEPIPPLRPNVNDREFYGGRVKFFKEVTCDCLGEYDLCIEKRYNPEKEDEELSVINMIVVKEGKPLKEAEIEKIRMRREEELQKAQEKIDALEAKMAEGNQSVKQRAEIKKQKILATIVDKDRKIATLMAHTTHELQMMCKKRKLKYTQRDSKLELAETLLAYDPSLVVANPEG